MLVNQPGCFLLFDQKLGKNVGINAMYSAKTARSIKVDDLPNVKKWKAFGGIISQFTFVISQYLSAYASNIFEAKFPECREVKNCVTLIYRNTRRTGHCLR